MRDNTINAIENLLLFPESGLKPKDDTLLLKNYRMLVVDNHLIFYVVLDDTIEIRYIIHGSRAYEKLIG